MSKTCGECQLNGVDCRCNANDKACEEFEQKVITNGDKIIAGGMRELAKAMVYSYRKTDDDGQLTGGMLYTWHLPNAKGFDEYNEAVDYLEAWLNAPEESEE